MMNPKTSILLELSFWLVLAVAAFVLTFEFSDQPGTYRWGAASWPRAVLLLMTVAALAHAWIRYRSLKESPAPVEASASGGKGGPEDQNAADGEQEPQALLNSIGLFLIPLAYVWLLPRTGFYLTTPFFLILLLLYGGERRLRVILATTLLIFTGINLVFSKLFFVALPIGNWPGFYDVNNWFLTTIR